MALFVLLLGLIAMALIRPQLLPDLALAAGVCTVAVMGSARLVANIRPSAWEALRSVVLSLLFAALVLLALGQIQGRGGADAGAADLPAPLGLALLWLAYGMGFVLGLGARLLPALMIAALATLLSAGLWAALGRLT